MTPRPDADTRAAARDQFAALRKTRDEAHEAADKAKADADATMWQAVADVLDAGTALQSDAAAALGFTRDHVAKQVARHRTT
jgi:hypothetical protein